MVRFLQNLIKERNLDLITVFVLNKLYVRTKNIKHRLKICFKFRWHFLSKLEPKSDGSGSGFLKSGSAKKIRIGEKNPDASGSESLRRNRIRSRLQQLAPGKNINTVIYDRQSVVLKSGFLTDTVPYRYFFILFFLIYSSRLSCSQNFATLIYI